MSTLSSAQSQSTSSIVSQNDGKITAFSYSITLIKNGTGKQIDIVRMVSSFDVYESLNNMSLCMSAQLVDTAGALVAVGIQPGDKIKLELYKSTSDKRKINSTLDIVSIDNSERIANSKGRKYSLSAIDHAAMVNKKGTVNKAFSGSVNSIVKDIATTNLSIDPKQLKNFEDTTENLSHIGNNDLPFDVIQIILANAVSSKHGAGQQFYFFQTFEGFNFQSLKGIIDTATTANNTWDYIVSTTMNQEGTTGGDFYRIIDFEREKIAGQHERMAHGVYENELVAFNPLCRVITNHVYSYKDDYQSIQLLGTKPVTDLKNNYDDWVTPSTDQTKWKRSFVLTYPNAGVDNETVSGFSENFAHMVAQAGLLNQNMYHATINGNPSMNVGDLVTISSYDLSGSTTAKMDRLLQGKYLVGNLCHHMDSAGETLFTYIDLFTDGPTADIYTDKSSNIPS